MRRVGPFTLYNRYLSQGRQPIDALAPGKSALGALAAAESLFIFAFVKFCQWDGTPYAKQGDATAYAAK